MFLRNVGWTSKWAVLRQQLSPPSVPQTSASAAVQAPSIAQIDAPAHLPHKSLCLRAHQQPSASTRNLQKDPALTHRAATFWTAQRPPPATALHRKYYEFSKLRERSISRANLATSTRHDEFNDTFRPTTSASTAISDRIRIESCTKQISEKIFFSPFSGSCYCKTHNLKEMRNKLITNTIWQKNMVLNQRFREEKYHFSFEIILSNFQVLQKKQIPLFTSYQSRRKDNEVLW